ncbi:MAG: trigger factor [Patescibacteria group bacterium]
MSYTVEKTNKQSVKIHLTIPAEQVDAGMEHAAEHMGEGLTIPGFRKGHAPFAAIKAKLGEMALLEHAAEELIRAALTEALIAEDLDIVGSPYFTMEKMAPGNDLVCIAEIALMPSVTKLADYTKLTVAPESADASDELLTQAKRDLQRMRQVEVRAIAGTKLEKGHKAVVDLSMKKDGVSIEGGDAKAHGIYTNEPHYVPGFVDAILGAAEGDERTFSLKFPEDHYQKHLAGTDVEFSVKLNEIFSVEAPEIDDAFAKTLGMENAAKLEEKLKENLAHEKQTEEGRRQEKAVLELLAKKSSFEEINELLVNQEIDKMVQELRVWVTENGMEFNEYMKSIGKSLTDMKLDFTPQAITRIKVALVIKDIAKKEKIVADPAAVDAELDRIAESVSKDPEMKERIYAPEYRDRVEQQLQNRAVIDFLKKTMVR